MSSWRSFLCERATDSYRSLLYLEKPDKRTLQSWTGPEGIEHYLAADPKGRLIQSLKSFLTSRTLKSTDVFGRRRTFEDLISRILRDLRTKAESQFGVEIKPPSSAALGASSELMPTPTTCIADAPREAFSYGGLDPSSLNWSLWAAHTNDELYHDD